MKLRFILTFFLIYSYSLYAQTNWEYQGYISGNYYKFSTPDPIDYEKPNHNNSGSNIYIKNYVYRILKSDSAVMRQIGFSNSNYWVKNHFIRYGYFTYRPVSFIGLDNSLGLLYVRERLNNSNRWQSSVSANCFVKTLFNNLEQEEVRVIDTRVFFGFEFTQSILFEMKTIQIGPFLNVAASHKNVGYQDYVSRSTSQLNNGNLTVNFRMGITIKP